MIKTMKGTQQKPDPNKPGDHIPISIRLEEAAQLKPEEEDIINKGVHLRRFRITIPMLNKYGYTEECEGCRFKQAGLNNSRAHSERCRRRLSEAVAKDEVDAVIIDRENERIAIRLDDKPEEAEDKEEDMGIDDSADNIGIEGENKDDSEMNEEPSNVYEAVLAKIAEIEFETELIKAIREASQEVDVAEVYSPPRVTKVASKLGLKPGEAMDLTNGWDFRLQRHKDAAFTYIREAKPKLVI